MVSTARYYIWFPYKRQIKTREGKLKNLTGLVKKGIFCTGCYTLQKDIKKLFKAPKSSSK
jgi:hypothetical protein